MSKNRFRATTFRANATGEAITDSIAVMYPGKAVRCGPEARQLSPPFDDCNDLLLSSVPEMKRGWPENVIAHRKTKSAGH